MEDLIAFIREKADQAEGKEVTAPTKPPERHKNKSTHHRSGKGFSNVTTAPTAAIPTAAPVAVSTSGPVSQPRGAPQAGREAYPPCKYSCPLCPENTTVKFSNLIQLLREKNTFDYTLCAPTASRQVICQQIVGQPTNARPAEEIIILLFMMINQQFLLQHQQPLIQQ